MFNDAEGVVGTAMRDEKVDVAVVEESRGVEKGEAVFFFTDRGARLIDGGESDTEFVVSFGGFASQPNRCWPDPPDPSNVARMLSVHSRSTSDSELSAFSSRRVLGRLWRVLN